MGNTICKCDSSTFGASSIDYIEKKSPVDEKKSDRETMHSTKESAGGLPPYNQSSESSSKQSKFEMNPGTAEELHRRCKEIFPICFEGGKFVVQKGLSNHFQISHSVLLSPSNTGYRFGATYVGSKMLGPHEAYPVLYGDVDLQGNASANAIHYFGSRVRCKASTQIQKGKLLGAQIQTDYRFSNATASLMMANTDVVNESGIIVGSYLRKITKSIDAGAELYYQYGKFIPGGQLSSLSYLARYTGQKSVTCASFGRDQLHLSYYHKKDESTQFGVEWETNFRMGDSTATFGYQLDIPKSGCSFKASIDTNWVVGSTLEKKLLPLPFTLALSGMFNHSKNQARFGIGLILG